MLRLVGYACYYFERGRALAHRGKNKKADKISLLYPIAGMVEPVRVARGAGG